jgi:hypothetical protein
LKNGVLLIVLRDEKTKDATSFSGKGKDEMLVVIESDIQECKNT